MRSVPCSALALVLSITSGGSAQEAPGSMPDSGAFPVEVAPAESLQVRTEGAGTPLVLLPGLFGSEYGYRKVIPLLSAEGYRSIVIEPLGVARSTRPERADYSLGAQAARLAAVLDTLRVSRAVVVAHSIGASVALRLTSRRPDLLRGLVLLDGGPAESATNPGFRRALGWASILRFFGGERILRGHLARRLRETSGDPDWVSEEVVRQYSAGAAEDLGATLRAYGAMARSREEESLESHLHEIRCPVRLVLGLTPHDYGPGPEEVTLLSERLTRFSVDSVPAAGYFIQEEAPGAVVQAVLCLAGACAVDEPTSDLNHSPPRVGTGVWRRPRGVGIDPDRHDVRRTPGSC